MRLTHDRSRIRFAQFVADPKPSGGSLFRIYRDTRFSNDKTPYKTNVAMHFPHRAGRDVHAPGYYLSLAPGEIECGVGIWRPDSATATSIRKAIANRESSWKKAAHSAPFTTTFKLSGESLKRVPSEFGQDHPMAEDLKRKDFVGMRALKQTEVTKPDFLKNFTSTLRDVTPFMKFLCEATKVPF
ncbi:MAG: DUF2461 domain-containing protein [Actinomycetota bacterium]